MIFFVALCLVVLAAAFTPTGRVHRQPRRDEHPRGHHHE